MTDLTALEITNMILLREESERDNFTATKSDIDAWRDFNGEYLCAMFS